MKTFNFNTHISTVVFFLFALINFAKAEVADLSLELEFDHINSGVVIEPAGSFRIIVTNNGPEAAGTNSSLTTPIAVFSDFVELAADGSEMNYSLDPGIAQDCQFGSIAVDPRPGDPPGFVFVFRTPVIQPNTSVTCHGIYEINFPAGTRTYQWNVNRHIDDVDPDLGNNTFPVTFGVLPPQVPGTSLHGVLMLLLGIFGLGMYKYKKTLFM